MAGGSNWRSPHVANNYATHDYADYAQEFLRRNPDYKRDYAATEARIAVDPNSAMSEREGLAGRWGLRFPLRP